MSERFEYVCPSCGHWVATLPVASPWIRGRCFNKRCDDFNRARMIFLRLPETTTGQARLTLSAT